MANYIASIVNVEYKYFEADAVYTTGFNGQITNICAPAQGVTAITREGDSIKMKTAQVTGELQINPAFTNGPEVVRLLLFIDKQGSIATTGSNLLENAGSASAVRSSLNQDNKDDVVILVDEVFVLDQYHPLKVFDYMVPVEMHQHFLATTTTVRNNGLSFAAFGQYAAASPTIAFHSHVSYVDN
jgi:hypothetical protein